MKKQEFTPEEIERARQAKAEYMRNYRKSEKVQEQEKIRQRRYWLQKADEMEAAKAAGEKGEPSC